VTHSSAVISGISRYGIALLGFTGLAAVATACHPGEPTNVAELDVVATAHDDTVNFVNILTYVMPESVVAIVPPESIATTLPFNHAYDQLILDGVATKLAELGYTRLASFETGTPDVVVLIKGVAVQNTDVYVTYPWWGYWGWYGWPCCYGPGWGVGYYPVVSVSQYDVGTIVVDMWDLRRADPIAMKVPAVWTAALRGLLEGSAADAPFRIDQAIDRAFSQSPYLDH
jgi:hypothetical protein